MAAGVEEVAANATQMATAGQQTRIVAERETTAAMGEIQNVVADLRAVLRCFVRREPLRQAIANVVNATFGAASGHLGSRRLLTSPK